MILLDTYNTMCVWYVRDSQGEEIEQGCKLV